MDTIEISLHVTNMIDSAIGYLSDDPDIYQRGSELVRVVRRTPDVMQQSDGTHVNREGEPMIVALSRATLFERLCTRIRWEKKDSKGNAKSVQPPEAVVRGLLDRGAWKGIKPLVAVTSSPTMRPDGTVLQKPGYDAATGIYYMASGAFPTEGEFPVVKELPTVDDARAALERVKDLVCDFPFETPQDRSAWLVALLSLAGRHMVNGNVPGFAIDATTRGTGKTMLVELPSIIVSGARAQTMSCPMSEEEWRKLITSLVSEGGPMMIIDNVSKKVSSPTLDSALTSTSWKDRKLGSTLITNAPVRGVWFFTGNNIRFGGDIPRRVLTIRLESKEERPELRTGFKRRNLIGWTQKHRASIMADLLTVLRAYALTTDKPTSRQTLGSYEHWSDVMPAVLEWLGEPNPLAKVLAESEDGDESKGQIEAVLLALEAAHRAGVSGYTARDLVDAAYHDPQHAPPGPPPPAAILSLKQTLESITGCTPPRRPDHIKLSYWLRRFTGRIVSGMRIVRVRDVCNVTKWQAQRVNGANQGSTTYEIPEMIPEIPGDAISAAEAEQLPLVD